MASPFPPQEADIRQYGGAVSQSPDDGGGGVGDIPRRLMRVKVLYTFDDQNKSNCLARLPQALSVPTISLDETTQIGVIELRTCIQAIVGASPELVAKLGHDYTVYAYDYSEYETPLVGQGMLSWILASTSTTPNAPAEQSQTMVTGRVCKNILGLFSNGIKETLEVKLKLVPVPTCMQREYVENMERYHNLSQLMPEGMDYKAWADFLKSNPTIEQLAHPMHNDPSHTMDFGSFGNMESVHQMLTGPVPPPAQSYNEQPNASFSPYATRPSSPAMSAMSYNPYQVGQDSRPASRASIRSESVSQPPVYHQPEEGPPKKRARVTKAARPKKAILGATNDSLRVTASTAASVRLHRPVATTAAAELASLEQVPRAPTPRPGEKSFSYTRVFPRAPPSLLRHTSMDAGQPSPLPYDSAMFSDIAVDSADDERGNSPDETQTPMDIPSSPPVMPQRIASSAPSSPGLPSLPHPADSGFVSDLPVAQEEINEAKDRLWEGSDLPTADDRRQSHSRGAPAQPRVDTLPPPMAPCDARRGSSGHTTARPDTMSFQSQPGTSQDVGVSFTDSQPSQPRKEQEQEQGAGRSTVSPSVEPGIRNDAQVTQPLTLDRSAELPNPSNRASTPKPPKRPRPSKPRGLPRSHTWSGEAMSDAAVPSDAASRPPRSGSGAKRKQNIAERLQKSIQAGELPTYCSNCGEIETPTWRKAYMRVEDGSPDDVQISSDGTGIVAFEVIEPSEDDDSNTNNDNPQYRIFKQVLTDLDKEGKTFTQLTLCNPCGLWLNKKRAMRPQEIWNKKPAPEKGKRKRNPPKGPRKKSKGPEDDMTSDAVVPFSDTVPFVDNPETLAFSYMSSNAQQHPDATAFTSRPTNSCEHAQMDDATAVAALQRAIQSSPVAVRGSKESPIDVEPDLTPKPTRRLLFPSPRASGEVKSLADTRTSISPTASKGHTSNPAGHFSRTPNFATEDIDKENCPPKIDYDGDDLAHLFEEQLTPKTTPTKNAPLQDLLKTPTPGSRRRAALTPRRGGENIGPVTPSRNALTPRSTRAVTIAPETPFTRQLNALLSDALSSPNHGIDFSSFPAFSMTPGRSSGAHFADFLPEDFLSSDMPIPSSPPGANGLGFSLYEDPATSTAGIWSGANIFENGHEQEQQGGDATGGAQRSEVVRKLDISVDFAAMIEGVVGGNEHEHEHGHDQERQEEQEARTPADSVGLEQEEAKRIKMEVEQKFREELAAVSAANTPKETEAEVEVEVEA